MNQNMKTLQDLKAGDQVATCKTSMLRSNAPAWGIETVERVTATQLVMPHGLRYNKKDGSVVGTPLSNDCIRPLTDALRSEIEQANALWKERNHLHDALQAVSFRSTKHMTIEQMRVMHEAAKTCGLLK